MDGNPNCGDGLCATSSPDATYSFTVQRTKTDQGGKQVTTTTIKDTDKTYTDTATRSNGEVSNNMQLNVDGFNSTELHQR
jgi:hypothetical protein